MALQKPRSLPLSSICGIPRDLFLEVIAPEKENTSHRQNKRCYLGRGALHHVWEKRIFSRLADKPQGSTKVLIPSGKKPKKKKEKPLCQLLALGHRHSPTGEPHGDVQTHTFSPFYSISPIHPASRDAAFAGKDTGGSCSCSALPCFPSSAAGELSRGVQSGFQLLKMRPVGQQTPKLPPNPAARSQGASGRAGLRSCCTPDNLWGRMEAVRDTHSKQPPAPIHLRCSSRLPS